MSVDAHVEAHCIGNVSHELLSFAELSRHDFDSIVFKVCDFDVRTAGKRIKDNACVRRV